MKHVQRIPQSIFISALSLFSVFGNIAFAETNCKISDNQNGTYSVGMAEGDGTTAAHPYFFSITADCKFCVRRDTSESPLAVTTLGDSEIPVDAADCEATSPGVCCSKNTDIEIVGGKLSITHRAWARSGKCEGAGWSLDETKKDLGACNSEAQLPASKGVVATTTTGGSAAEVPPQTNCLGTGELTAKLVHSTQRPANISVSLPDVSYKFPPFPNQENDGFGSWGGRYTYLELSTTSETCVQFLVKYKGVKWVDGNSYPPLPPVFLYQETLIGFYTGEAQDRIYVPFVATGVAKSVLQYRTYDEKDYREASVDLPDGDGLDYSIRFNKNLQNGSSISLSKRTLLSSSGLNQAGNVNKSELPFTDFLADNHAGANRANWAMEIVPDDSNPSRSHSQSGTPIGGPWYGRTRDIFGRIVDYPVYYGSARIFTHSQTVFSRETLTVNFRLDERGDYCQRVFTCRMIRDSGFVVIPPLLVQPNPVLDSFISDRKNLLEIDPGRFSSVNYRDGMFYMGYIPNPNSDVINVNPHYGDSTYGVFPASTLALAAEQKQVGYYCLDLKGELKPCQKITDEDKKNFALLSIDNRIIFEPNSADSSRQTAPAPSSVDGSGAARSANSATTAGAGASVTNSFPGPNNGAGSVVSSGQGASAGIDADGSTSVAERISKAFNIVSDWLAPRQPAVGLSGSQLSVNGFTTLVASRDRVSMEWASPSPAAADPNNLVSFEIQRTGPPGVVRTFKTFPGQLRFVDTEVVSGMAYSYTIRAVQPPSVVKSGPAPAGQWAAAQSVTIIPETPAAPPAPGLTMSGGQRRILSVRPLPNPPTGIRYQIGQSPLVGSGAFTVISPYLTSATTFDLGNVSSTGAVKYAVKAILYTGESSPWSSPVTAYARPIRVNMLSAVSEGTSLNVSFTPPNQSDAGPVVYTVQKSTTGITGPWTDAKTIDSATSTLFAAILTASAGTTHIRVMVKNSDGLIPSDSEGTPAIMARVFSPPGLQLTRNLDATVSWKLIPPAVAGGGILCTRMFNSSSIDFVRPLSSVCQSPTATSDLSGTQPVSQAGGCDAYYGAMTRDELGDTAYATLVKVPRVAVPAATDLTLTGSDAADKITVNWTRVPGVSYAVAILPGSGTATAVPYNARTLLPMQVSVVAGNSYAITVTGSAECGVAPQSFSKTISMIPFPTKPVMSKFYSLLPNGSGAVVLNSDYPNIRAGQGTVAYSIERKSDQVLELGAWRTISAQNGALKISATDTDISRGYKYTYRVMAANQAGNVYSDEVTFYYEPLPTGPSASLDSTDTQFRAIVTMTYGSAAQVVVKGQLDGQLYGGSNVINVADVSSSCPASSGGFCRYSSTQLRWVGSPLPEGSGPVSYRACVRNGFGEEACTDVGTMSRPVAVVMPTDFKAGILAIPANATDKIMVGFSWTSTGSTSEFYKYQIQCFRKNSTSIAVNSVPERVSRIVTFSTTLLFEQGFNGSCKLHVERWKQAQFGNGSDLLIASNDSAAVTVNLPTPVSSVNAVISDSELGILVSWGQVIGAAGTIQKYRIDRKVKVGAAVWPTSWSMLTDAFSYVGNGYVDRNIVNGNSYQYRISSFRSDSNIWSTFVSSVIVVAPSIAATVATSNVASYKAGSTYGITFKVILNGMGLGVNNGIREYCIWNGTKCVNASPEGRFQKFVTGINGFHTITGLQANTTYAVWLRDRPAGSSQIVPCDAPFVPSSFSKCASFIFKTAQ